MVPFASVVVVMFGGAGRTMVIDKAGGVGSVCDSESVTCGVKLNVPAVVGVPEIPPVAESKFSPGGIVPVTLQVNGGVPPVRWMVRL